MNIPFKNYLLSWVMKKRIHQIYNFKENPIKTQNGVLEYLLEKGKSSLFGVNHNFHEIRSYSEFTQKVKIRTYEDIFPYIEKIRSGERDILWPGKVDWFAKSSGTTNDKSKYIPVSKESLINCHFKGGKDMLSLYSDNFPESEIYNGKGLMMGGSLDFTNQNYTDGDLSAILLDNFPFWVNMHRIPDIETALMKDWESKLQKMTSQALKSDVTNITGIPSWMLVLFKNMLDKSGAKNISEIWPNLELYMHGGVNFEPFKKQFETLIPTNKMNYLEAYNASEGFFGIQDQKHSKDLLLMLDYGIFYEFIPLSEYNNGKREAITLDRIKIGVVYVLIISTNAGLWRYVIGDTIRFTSDNPFRIKIVGRTKSFLNSVGEELMVENTDEALKNCLESDNCSIKDYIVTSVHDENGKVFHHWIIEFVKEPKNKDNFMSCLDKNLRLINSDYDSKRSKNLLLQTPQLTIANKDLFYKWLEKNNRIGGQFKIPRLDSTSRIFNDIIKMNITY